MAAFAAEEVGGYDSREAMRAIGNVLWFVLGGFQGIPWAKACFVIGQFAFPFGNEAVSRRGLIHRADIGRGPLGLVGNVRFGHQHLKLAGIALAPIGKIIVPQDVAAVARR